MRCATLLECKQWGFREKAVRLWKAGNSFFFDRALRERLSALHQLKNERGIPQPVVEDTPRELGLSSPLDVPTNARSSVAEADLSTSLVDRVIHDMEVVRVKFGSWAEVSKSAGDGRLVGGAVATFAGPSGSEPDKGPGQRDLVPLVGITGNQWAVGADILRNLSIDLSISRGAPISSRGG